jgi:hypothetical protein
MGHGTTIGILDSISRYRALDDRESRALERAIRARRSAYRRHEGLWRTEDDDKAKELRNRGWTYDLIASVVRRSPHAIAARLRYLRRLEASA